MSSIDDLARAAASDLNRTVHPDVERLLRDLPALGARRRRRHALLATAAAVMVLVAAAVLALPAGHRTARQEPVAPSPSATRAGAALPPACADPQLRDRLPARYDLPDPCPATLPAGENVGVIYGLNLVRGVTVNLPTDGWTARAVGRLDGTELLSPDGDVIGLFPYPSLLTNNGGAVQGPRRFLTAARQNPNVRVVDQGDIKLGGWPFTWYDLTPSAPATLSDSCRLQAPCLPLMRSLLADKTNPAFGELRPGVTSRVFIEQGNGGSVQLGIWVPNLHGPTPGLAMRVLHDITLTGAFTPGTAPMTSTGP